VVHYRRFFPSGSCDYKRLLLFKAVILFSIAATLLTNCRPAPNSNTRSQPVNVTNLIAQLASEVPAPYTNEFEDKIPPEIEAKSYDRYCTPKVEAAIQQLQALGPSIYPELVKHLLDERYSYSRTIAEWGNYSVSDAIILVLSDQHMHSGYKWREAPSGDGSCLSFEDYLKARGAEQWAAWASKKSKLEIQHDFIDWCIAEEQKRGFMNDKQRAVVLKRYEDARKRLNKE
jgi:hypothetical protein